MIGQVQTVNGVKTIVPLSNVKAVDEVTVDNKRECDILKLCR